MRRGEGKVIPLPKFTEAEAEAAWNEFRFNCGPSAVAVMTGLTISELKPHLFDFPAKGYTNPMLMWKILNSIGVKWALQKPRTNGKQWPNFGLARIQWNGPWTAVGVPLVAAYRHTHWVGSMTQNGERGIFDINALNNGTGWVALAEWERTLVPHILKTCHPKATGTWFITHSVEIEMAGEAGEREK